MGVSAVTLEPERMGFKMEVSISVQSMPDNPGLVVGVAVVVVDVAKGLVVRFPLWRRRIESRFWS